MPKNNFPILENPYGSPFQGAKKKGTTLCFFSAHTMTVRNMRSVWQGPEPFIHTVFAKVYITPWNTGHSLLKTQLKMLISVETAPDFPVVHRKCINYYVNLIPKL